MRVKNPLFKNLPEVLLINGRIACAGCSTTPCWQATCPLAAWHGSRCAFLGFLATRCAIGGRPTC